MYKASGSISAWLPVGTTFDVDMIAGRLVAGVKALCLVATVAACDASGGGQGTSRGGPGRAGESADTGGGRRSQGCAFSVADTAELRPRLGELFTSDVGSRLSIAQVDSTSLGRLVRVDLRRIDGNVQFGGGGLLFWDPADGCVWVVKEDE